ncbi:MAG: DUF4215 domain-containing protein, partial [Candidatus Binatia bacterium]
DDQRGLVRTTASTGRCDKGAFESACGNGILDASETCDDGNTAAADGCSPRCQDEGCEAATPGSPATPLCSDGNECTVDLCNAAMHRCEHTAGDCSDGIACTRDSCHAGRCVHDAEPAACDDANACTGEVCSPISGCLHVPLVIGCDDGIFCNGADFCHGGACVVHDGDPCAAGPECANACSESSASCQAPAGSPCRGDANACTDDLCDGGGRCIHAANAAPCDDGLYCTGADSCRDATCSVHAGDPCGGECGGACDESRDQCVAGELTPCADDANPCTADFCDNAGRCVHEPFDGECDDRDFCSVGEVCTDGSCGEHVARSLVVFKFKVRLGGRPGSDRATWKAEFPATLLGVAPGAANLRVVLMDGFSSPVVDTTMPAGAFRGDRASWRYRAPADVETAGVVKASMAIDAGTGAVRARFKVGGVELEDALAAETLSVALLFGDEPGEAPCASSGDLECERGRRKLSCASPASLAAAFEE